MKHHFKVGRWIVRTWGAVVLRPYIARRIEMGGIESKPRDLGSDRGYRVAKILGIGGVESKPARLKKRKRAAPKCRQHFGVEEVASVERVATGRLGGSRGGRGIPFRRVRRCGWRPPGLRRHRRAR